MLRLSAQHFPACIAQLAGNAWIESRNFGVNILRLTESNYADYCSLIGGTRALDNMLDVQKQRFPNHVISLGPFAEGDPSRLMVEGWAKKFGLACRRFDLPRAPFLEITGPWKQYKSGKRKKFWHNINWTQKQLMSNFGPLEFLLARSPENITASLPSCMELYRSNWNRVTSSSIFLTESGDRFLRELLLELSKEGKCEIARLEQNGRLLAFSIGLTIDSAYYFYIFGTNKHPKYKRFSVGKIFLRYLLESVFERGFHLFDFMAGEEPYKLEWTRQSRSRTIYYIAANCWSARTRLFFLLSMRRLEAILKQNHLVRGTMRHVGRLFLHEDNRITQPQSL